MMEKREETGTTSITEKTQGVDDSLSDVNNDPAPNLDPTNRNDKTDESGHHVILTITVAVACARGSDESKAIDELIRKNKRTVEAPKPQQFFHCEYAVTPNEEKTIADIVTYGVAAKVFTENDSRVIKTWDDGPLTWVAWTHSHEMFVSEENILDLYNHTLEFKLWDSKEKVSAKARFDRPKAFRIPSTKGGPPGKGVAAVVAKQSRSWLNLQPRNSKAMDDLAEPEKPVENERTPTPSKRPYSSKPRSSLGRLAGLNVHNQEKKRINELKLQQAKLLKHLSSRGDESNASQIPNKDQLNEQKRNASESVRPKMICVPVKLELLFSGMKEITSRMNEGTCNVRDMYVTVTTGGSLMPEKLEKELNPLIVNIKSVKSLPAFPISREKLSLMCQPVHCSYKFPDQPIHKTCRRPHTTNVYFEDAHVVLAGRLDPGKLFEFIHSDGLKIRVHDRERKLPEIAKPPLIFGDDTDDKQLGNVTLVTAKRTTQNAFQDRNKVYDPYGVANVPLIELLQGRKSLNFMVVVNPCPLPDLIQNPSIGDPESKIVGVVGAVDRPENPPLPPGDYLNAGTILKVKVSLKYPLTWRPNSAKELPLNNESCPFSRIIFFFNFGNKKLVNALESFITKTNAYALGLDQFEQHVIEVALSTYKLTPEQRVSRDLDVITGFQVMDGEIHIMILEGLRNVAIKKLHEEIGKIPPADGHSVTMLYDSSISFNSRLYSDLDMNLCTVRLHQPLNKILEQPLLYVRDVVPRPCFQCLVLLKQITGVKGLRHVCKSNLFPDHDMVISMSREFGIPLLRSDFEDHHKIVETPAQEEIPEETQVTNDNKEQSGKWTPIDNCNKEFEESLQRRKKNFNTEPNHVFQNIVMVQEAGRRKSPPQSRVFAQISGLAHNYSTQQLNSTERSKGAMQQMLYQQDEKSRYAYNEIYNSAMVDPINEDQFYREEEEKLKSAWRTESGFIFPGVKSSMNCNVHPMRPDDARVDELKLKWRENTLHAHVLNTTLKRDIWSWKDRHQDLDLYKRPRGERKDYSLSIHLPGEKRLKEHEFFVNKAKETWKSKVVVDDIRMKFHRVCCNTEQTNKSNQVDKLHGILKDEPKKKALKFFRSIDVPPLSVVSYPGVDWLAREQRQKIPVEVSTEQMKNVGLQPGPYEELSWNMDKNTVPIKDPQHKKFIELKGQDFSTFPGKQDYRFKRPIRSLNLEEYEVFQVPTPPNAAKRKIEVPMDEIEPSYVDDRKSEYRSRYANAGGQKMRQPILPRHQFHTLAHALPHGSHFRSDASIQLMGMKNQEDNKEKRTKCVETA